LPASPFDIRLRQQGTLFDTHSIGLHLSQNVIMDSDVVFLCSQDERLSREKANYYMPAARSSGEPLGWIRPKFLSAEEEILSWIDTENTRIFAHRAEVRTSHSTKSKRFSRAPVFVFWQLLRARQRIE
jgi:hypothetical protein